MDGLAAEWPGLPLIGCTTDGEVSSEQGYTEDSLLLVLFVGVRGQVGVGDALSVDPEAATKAACEGLSGQLAITLPASMDTNLGSVMRTLRESLGCPLVGGASGDHRRFELIRQFAGTQVYQDALPVLTLQGDVEVGMGLGCGWEPVGTTYTVTGVEGNVLTQLDGQPVLEMLPSHAAMSRAELGEHPLAVFPPGESSFFLRPVFAVDLDAEVLAFAAEIPMGSRVRLTRVVREGILQGADEAAQAATQALPNAKAALVFTCAARKWLMGTRIEQEAEQVPQPLHCESTQSTGQGCVLQLSTFRRSADSTSGHCTPMHGLSQFAAPNTVRTKTRLSARVIAAPDGRLSDKRVMLVKLSKKKRISTTGSVRLPECSSDRDQRSGSLRQSRNLADQPTSDHQRQHARTSV